MSNPDDPKKPEDKKVSRDRISELLSGPENKIYADFVREYHTVFDKLRMVAEERDVDGLSRAQIELDPAGNEPKAKIEEAMRVAFENLPEVFEEFRESLRRMPGNSIRENLENLEQLKSALKNLQEFFGELQEKIKTNNAELISAIGIAEGGVEELMIRIARVMNAMEEMLG